MLGVAANEIYLMNTLPLKLHFTFHHAALLLLLIIILFTKTPSPATAQIPNAMSPPPPNTLNTLKFDKSMAIVLVILIIVFFILGFLSVYTRRCTEQRIRGRLDLSIPIAGGHRRHRGLDSEIIQTFPTFVYSTVKNLKIGRATLECVVCLNEFQDDETLRLIPKCSHVFHSECIDAWLVNHSTCPVCRANLVPKPGDTSFVSILIPDPNISDSDDSTRPEIRVANNDTSNNNNVISSATTSPKVNYSVTPNRTRPIRSRSTGFKIGNWFQRSHSTGHSLVQAGENYERFTLRLPEELRNRLVSSTLSRTTSCGVVFTREGSGRRGYRTRSVGRNYEWFNRPDRRGFSWTPPFMGRAGSSRSKKVTVESNKAMDDVGERSSDHLFAG